MKHFRKYMIALGVVALWAGFSWLYLGVEDGSSGLGPLGWITSLFLLPGGYVLQLTKGVYSNADLPLIIVLSFCIYAFVAVLLVWLGCGFLSRKRA
jgi:hypothetical protein